MSEMEQSHHAASQERAVPPQPSPIRHGSSKRKRSHNGDLRSAYLNTSPKRNRLSEGTSNEDDGRDSGIRSMKRTKSSKHALWSLSRRHVQEIPTTTPTDTERGSKFQEGSMNDKPSSTPPMLFTQDASDRSAANLDHLMDDYNGGHLRQSIEMRYPSQPYLTHSTLHDNDAPRTPSSETGLFRFGRMVASSFNPMNVWSSFSRTFKDTKEELTIRNITENRRKAQQKADAEAKYAEMKAAGQFGKSPFPVKSGPQLAPAARDDINGIHSAGPSPVKNGGMGASDSAQHPLKSHKSMFGIRRPSLSSLRVPRSDHNLSDLSLSQAHQSPLLASPTKKDQGPIDFLRKSLSRRDLGKQQRLSKRVSDLETKLAEARFELATAINDASPLPNLPSPFEKYKPGKHLTPTARFRTKFIPGQLPSLPSERLLFPEMNVEARQAMDVTFPAEPSQAETQLTHIFTPPTRPSHNQIPPSSIISTIESPLTGITRAMPNLLSDITHEKPLPDLPELGLNSGDVHIDSDLEMDQQTTRPLSQTRGSYEDLDARLKALDKAVASKNRKKPASKKRKSTDDMEYRPGNVTDDDEDAAKPKKPKKRKSAARPSVQDISQVNPASRKSSGRMTVPKDVTAKKSSTKHDESSERVVEHLDMVFDLTPTPIDSSRLSMDSQPGLDPIFEEDTVTAKHDSGVTITATQEKTLRTATRGSPPPPDHSAVEEIVNDIVSVTPGKGSAPKMPALGLGTTAKAVSVSKKSSKAVAENFDWPDDVF